MANDYELDYEFNKFKELIIVESYLIKLWNLYKKSKENDKKLLFLYCIEEKTRAVLLKLLAEPESLITNQVIANTMNKNGLFNNTLEYECKNNDCINHLGLKTTKPFTVCPSCKQKKLVLINGKDLIETFNILYLNYFSFYILNEVDKTLYVIRNKYNGKIYIKNGDEALSNWLYLKLVSNNCDLAKYLFAFGYETTNLKASLLKCLKEQNYIRPIDNINFKPELVPIFEDNGKKYINKYNGNKYLNQNIIPFNGTIQEKCPNIYELLNNLTGNDLKGTEYILDILAMILQEPYIKTKQLIIFYGEEASGKGTFYDLILSKLFESYITKLLGKKIKSNFNGFMSKNLILVLEEVKSDKEEEDTLKELITEDRILINEKNMPERYENNYLTIFGFSNEMNPINAGKRRGVYFYSKTLGGTVDKAPEFRKRFEENIPLELEDFVKLLKLRKYSRVEIMKGYDTAAKQQVLKQNESNIEKFIDELYKYNSLEVYVKNFNELHTYQAVPLENHIYKSNGIKYVQAQYIVDLYNKFYPKYNPISLNKFSQFWNIFKIDKENKDLWNRFEVDDKKPTYVNLDFINKQIKLRFDD